MKILGENVNLSVLHSKLLDIAEGEDIAIFATHDPRRNAVLTAVCAERSAHVDEVVERYNSRVAPYERITRIESLGRALPRSDLGKVLKRETLSLAGLEGVSL